MELTLTKFVEVAWLKGINCYRKMQLREFCHYCGMPLFDEHPRSTKSPTIDHIHPRSMGGSGWENQASACRKCNEDKETSPALIFLVERGGYKGDQRSGRKITDGWLDYVEKHAVKKRNLYQ